MELEYRPQSGNFDPEAFKQVVRKNLREGVKLPTIDDFDVAAFAGTSKTFVTWSEKSVTRSAALHKEEPKLTDRFDFKYSPVMKNAEEFRCAVTASPSTLFTINACMRQLKALNKSKIDQMGMTDRKWLTDWLSKEGTYLMVDQKKCGITFSKDLMKEVCDVIIDMYPDSYFTYFRKGLDQHVLWVNGAPYCPKRGLGLGMANELVSFAMACLLEYFFETNSQFKYRGLVFNDDQVIRVLPRDEQKEYDVADHFTMWTTFMSEAGLEVHPKKSFFSDQGGVFLEEYGRFYTLHMVKEFNYALTLFHALMAPNICVAKKYVADLSELDLDFGEYFKKALDYIISIVGFEFTYDEILYPYPIGWTIARENGYNRLFLEMTGDSAFLDRFLNVIAVGPLPKVSARQITKPLEGYANPYREGLQDTMPKASWLRKIHAFYRQRQRAWKMKTEKTASIYAAYMGYVKNDLPYTYNPHIVELDPQGVGIRDLFELGRTYTDKYDWVRVDQSRRKAETVFRAESKEILGHVLARAEKITFQGALEEHRLGVFPRDGSFESPPFPVEGRMVAFTPKECCVVDCDWADATYSPEFGDNPYWYIGMQWIKDHCPEDWILNLVQGLRHIIFSMKAKDEIDPDLLAEDQEDVGEIPWDGTFSNVNADGGDNPNQPISPEQLTMLWRFIQRGYEEAELRDPDAAAQRDEDVRMFLDANNVPEDVRNALYAPRGFDIEDSESFDDTLMFQL